MIIREEGVDGGLRRGGGSREGIEERTYQLTDLVSEYTNMPRWENRTHQLTDLVSEYTRNIVSEYANMLRWGENIPTAQRMGRGWRERTNCRIWLVSTLTCPEDGWGWEANVPTAQRMGGGGGERTNCQI